MRGKRVFHLLGVDVEAPCDDHVLLAVDDVEAPGVVLHGNVAGMQPAPGQRLLGQRRLAPVFAHHRRAAHADFARLARAHRRVLAVDEAHLAARHRMAASAQ
ncbi:hypothetical protein D3C79_1020510 [compost metagenome]